VIFDPWNHLEQVKTSGGTTLETYRYDALGRRIIENPGTQRDLYFSASWQMIEQRVSGRAQEQIVWSPAGTDMLVERDRDTTGNGNLSEQVWFLQDANGNVTAVELRSSAQVVERYVYDPYVTVTFPDANWNTLTSGSSAV